MESKALRTAPAITEIEIDDRREHPHSELWLTGTSSFQSPDLHIILTLVKFPSNKLGVRIVTELSHLANKLFSPADSVSDMQKTIVHKASRELSPQSVVGGQRHLPGPASNICS